MKKLFTVLFILIGALSFAQQKYALVIGNGNYANITKLNNPVNDANDMAAALQGLGFTVDKLTNATQNQMINAVTQLKNRLSANKNSYGFFYYAGHGVQSNGENFLIPVNANIQSESYLPQMALSVEALLKELNQAGNSLNVVVLDACRDNPFSWKRSGSRGLTVVESQPSESIIVFATSAGSSAMDGTGKNGLFTGHLLTHLKTPDLEVTEVFRLTMGDVARSSNNEQRPAIYNQFSGKAYLGSQPAPTGNMVRINGGSFQMGSSFFNALFNSSKDYERPQHKVTISPFYMGRYQVTVGDFRRFVNATGYKTDAEKNGGGKVWTGEDFEKKPDANWKNPYFSQDDNSPVVFVSWFDAVQYCNWLSAQEGLAPVYAIKGEDVTWNYSANGYRLPTEAEWEYACRAGTTTDFSTGNKITTNQANYNDNVERTTAVGSFAPNPWGLYDMHGNVDEWCWDWYNVYSSKDQTDPRGPSERPERTSWERAVRGGSWDDHSEWLRSARRNWKFADDPRNTVGFRIVRNF
jgi:formylglycine-generating enzyme required for sulfatase activity